MEDQKIIVTDTLKVEIFHMPIIDLSIRFCYRLIEPFPMIWQNDGRLSVAMNLNVDKRDIMGQFLLDKYRHIIEESKRQGLWHESLDWVEKIDKVSVIECVLTPTNEFVFSEQMAKAFKRG
jgi:hypothetical protein